jgi:hypothetical protein
MSRPGHFSRTKGSRSPWLIGVLAAEDVKDDID